MNFTVTIPLHRGILLIGPTGTGKTPFGEVLEQKGLNGMQCHHFDFGQELRRIAFMKQPEHAFTWDDHRFVVDVLEKGLLLEDEHFPLAEKIFQAFFERTHLQKQDVLALNGMPRHKGQARDISRIVELRAVVELVCSPDVIYKRIHQNTGGDRNGRQDDHLHLIEKKVDIYHKRTAPLIDYYAGRGCYLYRIDIGADMTSKETYEAFLKKYKENPCF